ncbi:MAG: right-handed parallel beta-helix repeat-containing protein [Pseudomonadota bacterium]|nr:right-handed parallel beta-helix repeat-containing protein [Pseudomonadota bacterium]
MKGIRGISIGLIVAAGLFPALAVAQPATPGRNFDHCTYFIDSLPAVIFETEGTFCLRRDLSTALSRHPAIVIYSSPRVTIDCNNFRIDGLQAAPGTRSTGILTNDSSSTTIRRCKIRGFERGIDLSDGENGLVEDNELDLNSAIGISAPAGGVIRRNTVRDTGISSGFAAGIATGSDSSGLFSADVIGNTITGVFSTGTAYGIHLGANFDGRITGNRVRDARVGIHIGYGEFAVITDNHLLAPPGRYRGQQTTTGISCTRYPPLVSGNTIIGFSRPLLGCNDAGNRIAPPR